MSKIKQLDERLANMIAAGEVVERPSSVVKELVENAIDALSTKIEIRLTNSGVDEIIVIDNGSGMSKDDAKLCFSRHATSKIKNEYDLFRIQTLGFRGEAIPSIASVSTFTLDTSDGIEGTRVIYKGGHLEDISNISRDKGTTISVKKLFYNVPARLKYLKSLAQELSSVTYLVSKFILANPHISFTLTNNNKVIYQTLGNGDMTRIFGSLYGLDAAKNLINGKTNGHGFDLEVFLVKPVVSRANKLEMTFIVNDRFVKSYIINDAIIEGYHTYLAEGRFPYILVKLTLDPSLVDVNVHPTKMQIKISNEEEIALSLTKLIKSLLNSVSIIPEVKEEVKIKQESYLKQTIFDNNDKELVNHNKEVILKEEPVMYNEKINLENTSKAIPNLNFNKETNEADLIIDKILGQVNTSKQLNQVPEKASTTSKKEELPYLEYCGQVFGTYLIFQNSDGMYLVDQHAAAERINYEYYLNVLSNPTPYSQQLLIPHCLDLTQSELIKLEENIKFFRDLGFEFDLVSNTVLSYPLWCHEEDIIDFMRSVLEGISKDRTYTIQKYRDHLAASIACKASVKANHQLSRLEIDTLMTNLNRCQNPYNCPHGRPTLIKFSILELEKLFKRVV